jgi:hypothetical protein
MRVREVRNTGKENVMRPVSSTAARYDLPTIWFHWAVTLIVASGIANAGFRAVGSFNKLF